MNRDYPNVATKHFVKAIIVFDFEVENKAALFNEFFSLFKYSSYSNLCAKHNKVEVCKDNLVQTLVLI